MPYNLLLLPLLGGFVFIGLCNRCRFSVLRGDGYRLLLQASVAGVFLLLVSIFLTYLAGSRLAGLDRWWHELIPIPQSGVTFMSFFLGLILGPSCNILFPKQKEGQRAAQQKGDPLELLLRRSVNEIRPVLITAKNGKVYCGQVIWTSDPSVPIDSVTLLPRISGYRRQEDRRVCFTTDYGAVLNAIFLNEDSVRGFNPNDLAVVIPIREIESACLFDRQIYDHFFLHSSPVSKARKANVREFPSATQE